MGRAAWVPSAPPRNFLPTGIQKSYFMLARSARASLIPRPRCIEQAGLKPGLDIAIAELMNTPTFTTEAEPAAEPRGRRAQAALDELAKAGI